MNYRSYSTLPRLVRLLVRLKSGLLLIFISYRTTNLTEMDSRFPNRFCPKTKSLSKFCYNIKITYMSNNISQKCEKPSVIYVWIAPKLTVICARWFSKLICRTQIRSHFVAMSYSTKNWWIGTSTVRKTEPKSWKSLQNSASTRQN